MTDEWEIRLCCNGLYYLFKGMSLYRNERGEYIEIDGIDDAKLICELLNKYEKKVRILDKFLHLLQEEGVDISKIRTE